MKPSTPSGLLNVPSCSLARAGTVAVLVLVEQRRAAPFPGPAGRGGAAGVAAARGLGRSSAGAAAWRSRSGSAARAAASSWSGRRHWSGPSSTRPAPRGPRRAWRGGRPGRSRQVERRDRDEVPAVALRGALGVPLLVDPLGVVGRRPSARRSAAAPTIPAPGSPRAPRPAPRRRGRRRCRGRRQARAGAGRGRGHASRCAAALGLAAVHLEGEAAALLRAQVGDRRLAARPGPLLVPTGTRARRPPRRPRRA